jgi:hypothetical protein
MLNVGDALPPLAVRDAEERPLLLGDLHRDAPLAAIFLRHFG